MGFLHEGHLTLVRRSREENQLTAASIFVNPTQFNDPEDLARYPRDLPADLGKLEKEGVDVVFTPTAEELYPKDTEISINPGHLENLLCGMSRPGDFRGMLTIVSKLFNLVRPERAYFGQKDFQQFLLISKMVADLNFPITLRMLPTLREKDGLAMSSRNAKLAPAERRQAPELYRSLEMGRDLIDAGMEDALRTVAASMEYLIEHTSFEIDYFSIVNPITLEDLEKVSPSTPYLMAVAAYLGSTRLIDNILHYPPAG